jgi:hypothetical protein
MVFRQEPENSAKFAMKARIEAARRLTLKWQPPPREVTENMGIPSPFSPGQLDWRNNCYVD